MARTKGSKNKIEVIDQDVEYVEVESSNSDLREAGIKQLVRVIKE